MLAQFEPNIFAYIPTFMGIYFTHALRKRKKYDIKYV